MYPSSSSVLAPPSNPPRNVRFAVEARPGNPLANSNGNNDFLFPVHAAFVRLLAAIRVAVAQSARNVGIIVSVGHISGGPSSPRGRASGDDKNVGPRH